jgi:hypothetical protein
MEMTDVAAPDLAAMPDDVAAAWASVLIDVHEKQSRQRVDDATALVADASQGQEDEHDD